MKKTLCRSCVFCQYIVIPTGWSSCCHYALITGKTCTKQMRDDPTLTHSSTACSFYERDPTKRVRTTSTTPKQPIIYDSLPHERIQAMYDDGLNDREIGDVLGLPKSYIYDWRHRRGLPANIVRIDEEKIREGYSAGLSDAEVAKYAGCSKGKVYTWREKNFLPPNNTQGRKRK